MTDFRDIREVFQTDDVFAANQKLAQGWVLLNTTVLPEWEDGTSVSVPTFVLGRPGE